MVLKTTFLFYNIDMNIDYDKLREDLYNYYVGLVLLMFLPAIEDAEKVITAGNEELIEIAIKEKFNLEEYKKGFVPVKKPSFWNRLFE